MSHYILDSDNNPIAVTLLQWAEWMEGAERKLARTVIDPSTPEIFVSTVFLGIDHNFDPDCHIPVLWETMVFEGFDPLDDFTERYHTHDQALAGHMSICRKVKEYLATEA